MKTARVPIATIAKARRNVQKTHCDVTGTYSSSGVYTKSKSKI